MGWPKCWPVRRACKLRRHSRRGLYQAGSGLSRQDRRRTEKEGAAYKAGKFPFTANGRARAKQKTDGFVKVLADAETTGCWACISSGRGPVKYPRSAVLMEFGGASEDLGRTCHAHPTMSEAVKEAVLAVDKRAIHS